VTRPFTIAHISDLHLSAEHKRHNLRRARRLLTTVAAHAVDHIILTGDVAADATRTDFEVARRLFKSHGVLDPLKLSLIVGNHDIFGGVHAAEDILTFPGRCREIDYDRKVEEFRAHFPETFAEVMFASHSKPFPYAKILGDVVLIGVNSVAVYSGVRNPVGSNGEVDDGQFRKLRLLLEAPPLRRKRTIVMIHHHFSKVTQVPSGALHTVWGAIERQTMKLRGKKRLLELFREHEVALVAHGHVHTNSTYDRKGVKFLNGGGSLLGPASPQVSFNLIQITREAITTRTVTVPDERPSVPAAQDKPLHAPEPELQAA
jgi:3',5'-cyclic AMP phosphodiesterase CpdA